MHAGLKDFVELEEVMALGVVELGAADALHAFAVSREQTVTS